MKSATIGFVFLAGFCFGAALRLAHVADGTNSAMAGVIILCSLAGFFCGGAIALLSVKHPSTVPAAEDQD